MRKLCNRPTATERPTERPTDRPTAVGMTASGSGVGVKLQPVRGAAAVAALDRGGSTTAPAARPALPSSVLFFVFFGRWGGHSLPSVGPSVRQSVLPLGRLFKRATPFFQPSNRTFAQMTLRENRSPSPSPCCPRAANSAPACSARNGHTETETDTRESAFLVSQFSLPSSPPSAIGHPQMGTRLGLSEP